MNPFGATTRACLTWLTAATTLLAAAPRVQCRCPDGRVTTFTVGQFVTPACCAGMHGGADHPSSADHTNCPRCAASHHSTQGDGSCPAAESGGHCTKTAVCPAPATGSQPAPTLDPPAPTAFLAATDPLAWRSAPAAGFVTLPAELLPPPDLVTILQRLTC